MNNNKKQKNLFLAIIVCFVASSFYIYDYILRVLPEALTHQLTQYFNLHAAKFGILASMFFWGYAPMQIPCGMLYDRFSPRKILTVAALLSALATVGFALTQSYALALFYRFSIGFTTSFAFVGALVVGASWFRGQYFAFYSGLVQFLGSLGAILGITPVVILAHHTTWRHTTLWIALLGVVLAILIGLIVRDPPDRKEQNVASTSLKEAYRKAFSHGQTWWVALYGFAIWAPITVFATSWGMSYYMQQHFNFSKVAAGNQISLIWWTIGLGGPVVGWLSKQLKTRRWPMLVCSFLGLISSLAVLFLPNKAPWLISLLLIGFGIGSSGLVLAFGLIVDLHPPEAVGALVGFTNMAVIFGGMTFLPAVGFIMQHLWNGTTLNGLYVYRYSDYQIALLVLPASFFIALITSFLVKETHCEKIHYY